MELFWITVILCFRPIPECNVLYVSHLIFIFVWTAKCGYWLLDALNCEAGVKKITPFVFHLTVFSWSKTFLSVHLLLRCHLHHLHVSLSNYGFLHLCKVNACNCDSEWKTDIILLLWLLRFWIQFDHRLAETLVLWLTIQATLRLWTVLKDGVSLWEEKNWFVFLLRAEEDKKINITYISQLDPEAH